MSATLDIERLNWSPAGAGALLRELSLTVRAGELAGLIGPNGSGKTSALRCAFRFVRPHAGTVTLDGRDVWRAPPRWSAQRIAVLQQEAPDDFGLTVEELARMGRTPHKRLFDADTADDARVVEAALRDVDLWALRERASRRCRAARSSARCSRARSSSSRRCCCSTNRPIISTCAISSNCSRACARCA